MENGNGSELLSVFVLNSLDYGEVQLYYNLLVFLNGTSLEDGEILLNYYYI